MSESAEQIVKAGVAIISPVIGIIASQLYSRKYVHTFERHVWYFLDEISEQVNCKLKRITDHFTQEIDRGLTRTIQRGRIDEISAVAVRESEVATDRRFINDLLRSGEWIGKLKRTLWRASLFRWLFSAILCIALVLTLGNLLSIWSALSVSKYMMPLCAVTVVIAIALLVDWHLSDSLIQRIEKDYGFSSRKGT